MQAPPVRYASVSTPIRLSVCKHHHKVCESEDNKSWEKYHIDIHIDMYHTRLLPITRTLTLDKRHESYVRDMTPM